MINHLDNMLRHLFLTQISEITTAGQVSFRPPDEDWRNEVVNLQDVALNVYLVDLRENRKLRSNERVRMDLANGQVVQQPAPARADCHYLISAWSPAQPNLQPTVDDEHVLLYQATAVLMDNAPLNPSRIYPPGSSALANTPEEIRDADLPTQILPVEGFPKLAEFWGTMGTDHRWKPVVYLVVTLPVVMRWEIAGPMVTTLVTEYRHWHRPETAEIFIQIGGHVQGAEPVLSIATGSATVTNINGVGTTVTVDDPSPFRAGDAVTEDESARATVTDIQGNDLILDAPIAGLANGDSLRIADIEATQNRFRVENGGDLEGVSPGSLALLTGEDAANPGVAVSERVGIEAVSAGTGFVLLSPTPLRVRTINLAVPPAVPPTLRPLAPQASAWVALEDQAGTTVLQTAETDEEGRFRFKHLHEGDFRLRVRASGFVERIRPIHVPSTTGDYDVLLDQQL